MPYTQTDADRIRAAIMKLATGEAVKMVEFVGPPARKIEYKEGATLAQLQALLAEVENTLSATPRIGRSIWVETEFDKGF